MKRIRRTNWSDDWVLYDLVAVKEFCAVEIGFSPTAAFPYCVQFRGNGHYFKTKTEALAYCYGRGWISYSRVYEER